MAKTKKNPLPKVIVTLFILAGLVALGYFGLDYYFRYTHPIKYSQYVEKYSTENRLNKYLVYSIIKTESGFNPDSVSNVGARGLMQIMEETFDWIKFRMGDKETEYKDMFDPETNIKYGCYLVGLLYDEFGNIDCTMSAYHAGRTRVQGWLEDSRYSSDGVTLKEIPIDDTNHYVNKIKNALSTYKRMYVD